MVKDKSLLLFKSHRIREFDDIKSPILTRCFGELFDNFNKEVFDKELYVPAGFEEFVKIIYGAHKQQFTRIYLTDIKQHLQYGVYKEDSKEALLGFSAGLDSVYQAIRLKEKGYNVRLFFLRNANMYENGQAYKYAVQIADKLGLPLIAPSISQYTEKSNPYRKFWPENPIKNQYIMAMMVDYCLQHGIINISMGDDFNLGLKDAAVGINLTDAREVTEAWLKGIGTYLPELTFIPIEKGKEKDERIRKLMKYGLEDLYYSCVQQGRFNQKYHNKVEEKYGVSLFHNNCGTYCRKCAMHNLILHYKGIRKFPDDFIETCWEKMWNNSHSADYVFFNPDIPLEQRIKNLLEY